MGCDYVKKTFGSGVEQRNSCFDCKPEYLPLSIPLALHRLFPVHIERIYSYLTYFHLPLKVRQTEILINHCNQLYYHSQFLLESQLKQFWIISTEKLLKVHVVFPSISKRTRESYLKVMQVQTMPQIIPQNWSPEDLSLLPQAHTQFA